ncbi:MAG: hypothetical protein QOE36_1819 [Gaiellaceae bacterium]|jgi:hypothetical protein|nr:hypothetical protein [Gaiellaceae bacterium]
MSSTQPRKTTKKVLLSIAAVAATAGLAGAGTYANFTGSVAASQTVSTGTMTIALGATGSSSNRLNINASAFAPTDTMQRSVDLSVTGTVGLSAINLTTADTVVTPTILSTDATNGLQIAVDRCSVPWTEAGVSPAFTYTCTGATTVALASSAVVGTNRALAGLLTAAGSTNYLRVTLTLPGTAGDTFQSKTATISSTFNGVQRAGISQ